MALLFRSGVKTRDFTPWRDTLEPGGGNFVVMLKAEADAETVYTAEHVEELIAQAIGDPIAREACEELERRLIKQGTPVPGALNDFNAGRAERERGPHWASKEHRNRRIIYAISQLFADGLQRFDSGVKSDPTQPPSACRAVAEAMNLSYEAVVKIWETFAGVDAKGGVYYRVDPTTGGLSRTRKK